MDQTMVNQNGVNQGQMSQSMKDLEDFEKTLHYQLVGLECDIYLTENKYIQETQQVGNVFKGFKEFNAPAQTTRPNSIISNPVVGLSKRQKGINQEKFFSLSSLSAPKNDDDVKSK